MLVESQRKNFVFCDKKGVHKAEMSKSIVKGIGIGFLTHMGTGGGEGGSPWLEPSFLHPSHGQKLHPTPSEAKITPPYKNMQFFKDFPDCIFLCHQRRKGAKMAVSIPRYLNFSPCGAQYLM